MLYIPGSGFRGLGLRSLGFTGFRFTGLGLMGLQLRTKNKYHGTFFWVAVKELNQVTILGEPYYLLYIPIMVT